MSTLATLKTIVSDVLEMDAEAVTPDLCAKTCPDWDSVRHISIIMMIEEQFDVTFEDEDFSKMTDFGALCALVESKIS